MALLTDVEKKENVFLIIDEIIDRGRCFDGDVENSLHSYININRGFANRCYRTFGSVRGALLEYGYYQEPIIYSDLQVYNYIKECFFINKDFHNDYHVDTLNVKIANLELAGYDVRKCKGIIKQIKMDMHIDAVEKFIDETCVSEIAKIQPRYVTENSKLEYSIRCCFGSWNNFYLLNGIDTKLTTDNYSFHRRKALVQLGNRFEKIVHEVLTFIDDDVITDHYIGNCRPDFVINDEWYDAKLSKSTVIYPKCQTIEKYRKHTDSLTIIYAIDDTDDLQGYDEFADFVHITVYYPYIPAELQREIDEFIESVKRVKANNGKEAML